MMARWAVILFLFGFLWVALSLQGCALKTADAIGTKTSKEPEGPVHATSGVLRLIGHDSLAQGCPIAETVLLTARHVATEELETGEVRRRALVWSDLDGHIGSTWTEDYDLRRDLAVMRSDQPFARVYPLAREAPVIGERVWIVGYDFEADQALRPKVVTVRVLNVIGAHLILSSGGTRGFSGSCVLNTRGEVVGVFTWVVSRGFRGDVGVASAAWSEWGSVAWLPPAPARE